MPRFFIQCPQRYSAFNQLAKFLNNLDLKNTDIGPGVDLEKCQAGEAVPAKTDFWRRVDTGTFPELKLGPRADEKTKCGQWL